MFTSFLVCECNSLNNTFPFTDDRVAQVASALAGEYPLVAQMRGINPRDGIFQIVRLPYDYERDSDLGIIQSRVAFGAGNDTLLDTPRGGRIADLRYSTLELEAGLVLQVPPPTPLTPEVPPREVERPRPEFGSLQAVSFEISDLYLPDAELTGDSYSPEEDSTDSLEPEPEKKPPPSPASLVPAAQSIGLKPRIKPGLLAKLANRNREYTPGLSVAMHGIKTILLSIPMF